MEISGIQRKNMRKNKYLYELCTVMIVAGSLLFGMHRVEAFQIDVWIKRVLSEYYPNGFPDFAKDNAGIAQQYIFHYARMHPELF